jgi:hypothetical protein
MKDDSLKSPLKKQRGTFFSADVERVIASLKQELAHQVNDNLKKVLSEYTEIMDCFNQQPQNKSSAEKNILDLIKTLESLFELTYVFKRVKPYCNFVNVNLLPPINLALEKIRLACGCDLNDVDTWDVATCHTATICKFANKLESSKVELNSLNGRIYDGLAQFVWDYKSEEAELKRIFIAELSKNPTLMAWVQPWIDIAEGLEVDLRKSLAKAIVIMPEKSLAKENTVNTYN